MERLLLENAEKYILLMHESHRKSEAYDLCITHLNDSTIFAFNSKDTKLLVMAAESRLNNHSISPPFPFNPFTSSNSIC